MYYNFEKIGKKTFKNPIQIFIKHPNILPPQTAHHTSTPSKNHRETPTQHRANAVNPCSNSHLQPNNHDTAFPTPPPPTRRRSSTPNTTHIVAPLVGLRSRPLSRIETRLLRRITVRYSSQSPLNHGTNIHSPSLKFHSGWWFGSLELPQRNLHHK